ncbi:MAG: hypothetical protein QXP68_03875 [Thermosphaera sp.]
MMLKVEYKKNNARVDVFGAFFESYTTTPDRLLIDGRAVLPEPESDMTFFIDAVLVRIVRSKNMPPLIEIVTALKSKS